MYGLRHEIRLWMQYVYDNFRRLRPATDEGHYFLAEFNNLQYHQ